MNIEQRVYEKVMEKLAHDFTAEAQQALADYRKRRDEELNGKPVHQLLHRAIEGYHENVTPILSGPMTSPTGHIASGFSPVSRAIMSIHGASGPQSAPIVTLHELDEAKGSDPDRVRGDAYREFLRQQIRMHGAPSITIGTHVGPYVLMNESNRVLEAKEIDPKTYEAFKKLREKQGKLFNWVYHKSESDRLKELVPGLPGYGERPYTDAEIEAANNAIVNTKDAKRIVDGYSDNKNYHPELKKHIAEAVALVSVPMAVYGLVGKFRQGMALAKALE